MLKVGCRTPSRRQFLRANATNFHMVTTGTLGSCRMLQTTSSDTHAICQIFYCTLALFFFQELPRVFTATTEATGAAQSLGKVVQQVVFQMSDPKLFLA